MKQDVIEHFPAWALCYVVNGDKDCLEDEEIKQVDEYIEILKKQLNAKWIDICPTDEESFFSAYPEFGKACDCVRVNVLYEEEVKPELTPMLKQFLDLKKKHPDALLLFRCGDFYETYMQDAEKSSKILGITLTKSSKTKDPDGKPLAMAGFPYHALDTYLPKLIRAGYRIAICDQIELPKKVGKRKISEIVTPQPQATKQGFHR